MNITVKSYLSDDNNDTTTLENWNNLVGWPQTKINEIKDELATTGKYWVMCNPLVASYWIVRVDNA